MLAGVWGVVMALRAKGAELAFYFWAIAFIVFVNWLCS